MRRVNQLIHFNLRVKTETWKEEQDSKTVFLQVENLILSVMLMLTLLDSAEDLSCAGAMSPVYRPAVPHKLNFFGRFCITLQRPAGQTS